MLKNLRKTENPDYYIFDNKEVLTKLKHSLKEDKLIKFLYRYIFYVDKDEFKINGVAQPLALQMKYEDLIRNLASVNLKETFNLTIEVLPFESNFILKG